MNNIVKVTSVKLETMERISDKCWKATSFNGESALIPESQYFGVDMIGSGKSDAYWLSNWILSKVNIQHSSKRQRLFDKSTRTFSEEKIYHSPKSIQPVNEVNADETLIK